MVTYEITALVFPHLVQAYERYMRERHIPEILGTGCFQGAMLTRAAPGRYRVRYEAQSEADLERYLAEHAPRLRTDFGSHFPDGVTVSREVWVTVQAWDAAGRPAD
ncbi:MAG: DUF4286 family protein [Gemmatimonadales bacterium]